MGRGGDVACVHRDPVVNRRPMALFQLGRRALVPELLARWRGSCAGMATGSGEPVRGASRSRAADSRCDFAQL